MNTPLDLELRFTWRREDFLREAAAERLAIQARGPAPSARARLAHWLYALATRIDSECQVYQNARGPSSA